MTDDQLTSNSGTPTHWTRRRWVMSHCFGLVALTVRRASVGHGSDSGVSRGASSGAWWQARAARHFERLDAAPWEALAQRAVEAARSAGARYAEARLTREVRQEFGQLANPMLTEEVEYVGVGIRALVGGYWGFSATTVITPDEVVRLARDAVAQAQESNRGPIRQVELGSYPVAAGQWSTPIRIDPFTVSIEEKTDFIKYWEDCCVEAGLQGWKQWRPSWIAFFRQERVVATSEGALFTQTTYESGGRLYVVGGGTSLIGLIGGSGDGPVQAVHGIDWAGAGWELFLDANIPEQFSSGRIKEEIAEKNAIQSAPFNIGKYTLVCDGRTMASLAEMTLGPATQLDRALGYEANAEGTSWITDPLGMIGTAKVAAPSVTLTANRSAPAELATVKWDDEGVEPAPFTLVKDGILVDFQTTREQAAWLEPIYKNRGQPIRSHGCAASQDAHGMPLQQLPNLELEPNGSKLALEDMVADVASGILMEECIVADIDFQGSSGLIIRGDWGTWRQIKNGKVGKYLQGGSVFFNSHSLWNSILAVGGPTTQGRIAASAETGTTSYERLIKALSDRTKGEPPQFTSHSVRAVAAVVPNQAVIDPLRKA